ncbi:MAG: Extracellular ligand-binding receptor, partial [Deltaproteobacteria bacterium]|nr:Extracellular ligand-binding receptor [Deltaproteobacteria bacterium]
MKGSVGKTFIAAAAILSLVVVASAGFAETVKVGVLLPLTGSQAKFGEIEKRSYEMAAEEINAKGGVNGKKVELLFEDDTGKPDVGRSGVEKLISREKVPVITGGYSSSVTAAAAPVAQQFKVPFVICTGSADDVTEKGYDYVFRVNPPASEYPNAIKSFLQGVAKDVKTVALLYENSAFGQSSSKSFEEDAKGLGLNIVVKEGYQAGAIDFKPILTKVKAANPDMIYMVSYVMDASLLMRQSKELRINPKMFVGGGAGFTLPEFAKSAGDAADGVFSATLWVETLPFPGAKEYFDKYKKKYGDETE